MSVSTNFERSPQLNNDQKNSFENLQKTENKEFEEFISTFWISTKNQSQEKRFERGPFYISEKNSNDLRGILFKIFSLFEEKRKEREPFTFYFTEWLDSYYFIDQKNKEEELEIADNLLIERGLFEKEMRPRLVSFLEKFEMEAKIESVDDHQDQAILKIAFQAVRIDINWKEPSLLELLPVLKVKNLDLYEKFQNEEACDFEIKIQEATFKLHSEAIRNAEQDLLDRIKLLDGTKDFDSLTFSAFTEFLYLGADGIPSKTIKDSQVDLFNLFQLASQLKWQPLINHTANLISLISNRESIPAIEHLVETYGNNFLKKLLDCLKIHDYQRV